MVKSDPSPVEKRWKSAEALRPAIMLEVGVCNGRRLAAPRQWSYDVFRRGGRQLRSSFIAESESEVTPRRGKTNNKGGPTVFAGSARGGQRSTHIMSGYVGGSGPPAT